jgi:hypothetical protein
MLVLLMLLQLLSPDIIVSGKRVAEEYATCHRGSCTPLRDAQVSIAFAELQFREGRYLDAKHTLSAAVARNRTQTGRCPVQSLCHGGASRG